MKLDKTCYAHDSAYSGSKHLAQRIVPDKTLKNSAFEIARIRKYNGYQGVLQSMVYKFFTRKQHQER